MWNSLRSHAPFISRAQISQWSTLFVPPRKRHAYSEVEVKTSSCASLIRRFGMPLYLKIDIEA